MSQNLSRRAALGTFGAAGLASVTACGAGQGRQTPQNLVGKELVKAADVPVGGGKIIGEHKIFVVQPSEGVFKAFSSVCTHQGCGVTAPRDGKVSCPCHGSEFDAATGEVLKPPAKAKLREYPVEVKNGAVVVV
ncbi:Rieske (2Fe-2S) protein [Actinocorallia sp. A-T 12471]|uniref:Rieske (2Fe-2S) protein n=1 Tax=Actinocorallia sp. A-T 12471 TaxID=3089813 RepID=UPI0029CCF802|nr:Rieske (2Fe-2S) protein [Actinocorallia sp. A-T 12471]MDX6744938.1 Rieske (2Fe-2S) protein [Actinocorallia sp. A-T 12471]